VGYKWWVNSRSSLLVTAQGELIRHRVRGVTREQVLQSVQSFRRAITNIIRNSFQPKAEQLYEWLIAPLEDDLQTQGINNLTFILDTGLRSVPLAALHNATAVPAIAYITKRALPYNTAQNN